MRSHGYGDVGAKQAGFLAFPHHTFNQIKILHQKVVRKLAQELEAVPQFGLEYDGQVAVVSQTLEMQEGDAPQFFPGIGNLGQGSARPVGETMEGGVDGRHQQLVFVLEIKIDSAVRHAGAISNLRHPRVKEAVFGNDLDGGMEVPLAVDTVGFTVKAHEFTWNSRLAQP